MPGIIRIAVMVCALSYSISAQAQSIEGDGNICNVIATGNDLEINMTCDSIDDEILRKLVQKNIDLKKSQDQIVLEINKLARTFVEIRNSIFELNMNNASSDRVLSALYSGNIEEAKMMLGIILDMASSIEKIEKNTDNLALNARVDSALEQRSGARQGQVEAIERLISMGQNFTSFDFSGVNLDELNAQLGQFDDGKFALTTFVNAIVRGSSFRRSDFRLADFSNADFSDVDMSRVYAPFASGSELTSFEDANLDKSDFFAASFKGVNFSGASLKGTSFAFSDLREADFSNANLSDAVFAGAILDNAKFEGAIFSQTNVFSASAANVSLSSAQHEGLCRVELEGGGTYHFRDVAGWEVRIVEAWPSAKYDSGHTYEELLKIAAAMPRDKSRSLPVCTHNQGRAGGNKDPRYQGYRSFKLWRNYLRKAGRIEKIKERIKKHTTLYKSITSPIFFQGDGTQKDHWLRYMKSISIDSVFGGTAYLTVDSLLVYLIAQDVIDEQQIDWKRLSRYWYDQEKEIHSNERLHHVFDDGWPFFYPENVVWSDIQKEAPLIYRNWVMKRAAEWQSEQFSIKVPSIVREDGTRAVAFLGTGYIRDVPSGIEEGYGYSSDSALKTEDYAHDRKMEPNFRASYLGYNAIFLVFPDVYDDYVVVLDKNTAARIPSVNPDLDIRIKFENIKEVEGRKKYLIVWVDIQNARVRDRNGEWRLFDVVEQ